MRAPHHVRAQLFGSAIAAAADALPAPIESAVYRGDHIAVASAGQIAVVVFHHYFSRGPDGSPLLGSDGWDVSIARISPRPLGWARRLAAAFSVRRAA